MQAKELETHQDQVDFIGLRPDMTLNELRRAAEDVLKTRDLKRFNWIIGSLDDLSATHENGFEGTTSLSEVMKFVKRIDKDEVVDFEKLLSKINNSLVS